MKSDAKRGKGDCQSARCRNSSVGVREGICRDQSPGLEADALEIGCEVGVNMAFQRDKEMSLARPGNVSRTVGDRDGEEQWLRL